MTPDQLAKIHAETKDARAAETAAVAAQLAAEEAERVARATEQALAQ